MKSAVNSRGSIYSETEGSICLKCPLWTQFYSLDGINSVTECYDGNYVIASNHAYDIVLLKLNSAGNQIWTRFDSLSTFGGKINDLKASRNGGYLISGEYSFGGDYLPFLLKIDFNGDLILSKKFNTNNGVSNNNINELVSISETQDYGIILLTNSDNNAGSPRRIYLVKTDERLSSSCNENDVAKQVNRPYLITNTIGTIYEMPNLGSASPNNNLIDTVFNYFTDSICETCAPPNANFTYWANGLSVQFFDSLSYGTAYQWSFGDNASSTIVNPTHTYSVAGTYTVCIKALNKCGIDSICKPITVPFFTNVPESNSLIWANIYPNPNKGIFKVECTMPDKEQCQFELYDLVGRRCASYIIQKEEIIFTISEQSLLGGIYFYNLSSNGKTIQQGKIVVIK
jgi:hypothetical protein